MSNPLASSRISPPGSRNPKAIRTDEPAQITRPSMVRMFGVRCRARSTGTTRRAPDLTQFWSLDVNTGNHRARTGTFSCDAIHIEHLVDDVLPVIQLRCGEPSLAHGLRACRIIQQRAECGRPLLGMTRGHKHAVNAVRDHTAEAGDR